MKNVEEAFEEVARILDCTRIAPDARGWVELEMPDGQSLYVERVDDTTLELSSRVDGSPTSPTADQLNAILTWNTHNLPIRLSIENGKGLIVGARHDVRDLDAKGIRKAMSDVVLATNAVLDALATQTPETTSELAFEDGLEMIRI